MTIENIREICGITKPTQLQKEYTYIYVCIFFLKLGWLGDPTNFTDVFNSHVVNRNKVKKYSKYTGEKKYYFYSSSTQIPNQ